MKYKMVKLGNYLYIKGRIGWKGLKKEEYLIDGDYRIINGESLTDRGIDWSKAGFITKERYDESPEIMLQEGDILLSKDGTIGKIGYVTKLDKPTSVASGIFVIRNVNPREIDTDFIYYYLTSPMFKNFIKMRTEGSVIPHLYQKDFVDLDIPFPEVNLQKMISSILRSIDKKIELNKKINDNLQQQAFLIYKEIFLDNEYDIVRTSNLGNLTDCVLGGTPSRAKGEYWNGNINWINSGEVNEFRIIKPSEKITELGLSKSATKLLPKKTTVVAITGATLGQYSLLEIDTCTNQSVVGVIPNALLPYEFIYPFIHFSMKELVSHQTGGAQQHINKQNVEGLEVNLPSKEVMNNYSQITKSLYDRISVNCFENQRLSELRDTLLPKLMSGEIDVSNIKLDL